MELNYYLIYFKKKKKRGIVPLELKRSYTHFLTHFYSLAIQIFKKDSRLTDSPALELIDIKSPYDLDQMPKDFKKKDKVF